MSVNGINGAFGSPVNNQVNGVQNLPLKPQVEVGANAPQTSLPSADAVGASLVNRNLPMSYTKLGDITFPGLKGKAGVFMLANGQKVIVAPKDGPTVIKTTYKVGSMNEPDNLRGMSHFIEHNLFNGSRGLQPGEFDNKISALGGDANAGTNMYNTSYYAKLQLLDENSLEEAIKLCAEQTQYPTFDSNMLEKEKDAVKSEIAMYKDDDDSKLNNLLFQNLFGIDTTSSDIISGNCENINNFTREQVVDFFNTWYTPDNAITVITGDVDVNETMTLVSKYFNKQNDYSNINKRQIKKMNYIQQATRNDIVLSSPSENSIFHLGFAVPEGVSEREKNSLIALSKFLNSKYSNLSKSLENTSESYSVLFEHLANNGDDMNIFHLWCSSHEEDLDKNIQTMYDEIAKVANGTIQPHEFEVIRKNLISGLNTAGDSSEEINDSLLGMALKNDFNDYQNKLQFYQTMTPLDLQNAARKFLDLNKASLCVGHKNGTNLDQIDKSIPKPAPVTSMPLQNQYSQNYPQAPVQQIVQNPSQAQMQMTQPQRIQQNAQISFGGSYSSPKQHMKEIAEGIQRYNLQNNAQVQYMSCEPGEGTVFIANFDTNALKNVDASAFDVLEDMLCNGATNKAVSSNLLDKRIGLVTSVDRSSGLQFMAAFDDCNSTGDAISAVKTLFMSPNLTQEDFENSKARIRDDIINEHESAYSELYRNIIPHSKTAAKKEERLKQLDNLTLNDINALYQKILYSSTANFSISTPIKQQPQLTNMINNGLSQWAFNFQPQTGYVAPRATFTPNTKEKTHVSVTEDSQARITQAYKFKDSDNINDIAKIKVLRMILGEDGAYSRLYKDLREKEGLAYRTYSDCTSDDDTGAIYLNINTTTDALNPKDGSPSNVTRSLDGFKRNVDLLKTMNVSDEELSIAKTRIKTNILNSLETSSDKMAGFASKHKTPYGNSYYEKLLDAIDNVTADDVRNAANYVFKDPPITSIEANQKTLDALKLKPTI